MDLVQVCSYDAPRVTRWNIGTEQANFRIFPETFLLVYSELVTVFVLMKSGMSLKMVHFGSKTRSQVQILEKPCVCSRGHIFSPIIMKLGQNVFIDKSWSFLKMDHFGSKTRSNLLKTLCTLYRPHFQSDYHESLSECLSSWNLGQVLNWVMLGLKLGQ